jgi:hypothetical protein
LRTKSSKGIAHGKRVYILNDSMKVVSGMKTVDMIEEAITAKK